MREKFGVVALVAVGVLLGCGGSEESSDGEVTIETVKACLEEQAPGPFEVDNTDPSAPRILGDLRKNATLSSFAQVTVFENPSRATRQAKYETNLYKSDEAPPQSVVAEADNVLLNYQYDIPKADLALLKSCTTPG